MIWKAMFKNLSWMLHKNENCLPATLSTAMSATVGCWAWTLRGLRLPLGVGFDWRMDAIPTTQSFQISSELFWITCKLRNQEIESKFVGQCLLVWMQIIFGINCIIPFWFVSQAKEISDKIRPSAQPSGPCLRQKQTLAIRVFAEKGEQLGRRPVVRRQYWENKPGYTNTITQTDLYQFSIHSKLLLFPHCFSSEPPTKAKFPVIHNKSFVY